MITHNWETTGDAPPSAWAALVADMRRVIIAARARGILLTGPDYVGDPILDGARIALAVKVGDRPFSSPFVLTRTAGTGLAITELGDAYDALVLTALSRAQRHLGALMAVSTDATRTAAAMRDRMVEQLFGAEDRSISGGTPPSLRAQAQAISDAAMDAIDTAGQPPADLIVYLSGLIDALAVERDVLQAAASTA